MRAGKGESVQFRGREPMVCLCGFLRETFQVCAPGFQRNAVAGDGVFDDAKFFDIRERKTQFVLRNFFWIGTAGGDFHVREFPKVRIDDSGGPLSHEESSAVFNDKRDEAAGGGWSSRAEIR